MHEHAPSRRAAGREPRRRRRRAPDRPPPARCSCRALSETAPPPACSSAATSGTSSSPPGKPFEWTLWQAFLSWSRTGARRYSDTAGVSAVTAAIKRYQRDVFGWSRPDGLVEPGGKTHSALAAGRKRNPVALPSHRR